MGHSHVTRRSFLLMVGAAVLGRFRLPVMETGAIPRAGIPDLPDTGAVEPGLGESVCRLVTPPTWGSSRRIMVWMELDDSGEGVRVMMCQPETAEDQAEAERFYEAACWRSWNTVDDLRRILRDPGPWLVRWNCMGQCRFLLTEDEARLFGPHRGGETLARDPQEAARLTSAKALALIPRLMEEWEQGDSPAYFEPVRPEDAMKDRRAELLACPPQTGPGPPVP